ncbi:MAG: copper homeostasis protein CutC [Flaviaesturariibacter sp.]|nr:copper homeostasis protein CutC [Flaviaesturariibacter sp.]
MNYLIEIATADLETTRSAVEGGADRIELCAGLSEGGTTPSYGTIRQCREMFAVSLFPIIRIRGGDFLYSDDEFTAMLSDARLCRELGCEGVVAGFLLADGSIDRKRTEAIVEAVYPLELTFHRAFDRCRDPFEALETLIQSGCQRILTSGQQPDAPGGADLIAQLVRAADERIVIMPGSGVRPENIRALANHTGAAEFHSSLRSKRKSDMKYRHAAFGEGDFMNPAISAEDVRALRAALEAG